METLKYFRAFLLGHRITEYKNHKNITFDNFTIERVLRWRLMLEQYGPEIKYITGPDNDAADALSRLSLIKSDITERDIKRGSLSESYSVNKLYIDTFPLT